MPAPPPGGPAAAPGWLAAAAVDPAVLSLCPGYTALLITADGLVPGPSDAASDAVLTAAESRAADPGVTCRRWNWRQCARTRITAGTTRAVFILDGLPELGAAGLDAAAGELQETLAAFSPGASFARRLIA